MSDYQGFNPDSVTSASFTMTLERVIGYTGGEVTIADDGVSRITNNHTGTQYLDVPSIPGHADILRGKIVDRFWKREIGLESIEMFQMAMRTKLNEVMPYFNQLYASTTVQYEALSTVDVENTSNSSATSENTSNETSTSNNDTKSTSRAVSSTTPQTMLAGNKDYASGASDSTGDVTSDTTAEADSTQSGTLSNTGESRTKGFTGVASELIMQYRASLINIDVMVLDSLEELFMGVWDTGDSYYPHNSSMFMPSTLGTYGFLY